MAQPGVIVAAVELNATMKGGEHVTNTALLQKYIDDSGYKLAFIAEKLDLSPYGFARKRDNKSEFLPSEIDALCILLHINTLEERFAVFFASKVELDATSGGDSR